MKNFFCALVLSVIAISASAVSNIPVPISEDNPLRLGGAAQTSFLFSPLAFQYLGADVGLAYAFGGGFEGGFSIRGGVTSDELFQTGHTNNGILGADVMLRYLGNLSDSFYMGLQGRVGYDYTFGMVDITAGSNITAAVGLPFGITFGGQVISLYLMPEINFGQKDPNSTDGVFGSLVGFGAAIGTYVCLGTPKIYAQVKPKTLNIAATSNNWAMDAEIGLAFEI